MPCTSAMELDDKRLPKTGDDVGHDDDVTYGVFDEVTEWKAKHQQSGKFHYREKEHGYFQYPQTIERNPSTSKTAISKKKWRNKIRSSSSLPTQRGRRKVLNCGQATDLSINSGNSDNHKTNKRIVDLYDNGSTSHKSEGFSSALLENETPDITKKRTHQTKEYDTLRDSYHFQTGGMIHPSGTCPRVEEVAAEYSSPRDVSPPLSIRKRFKEPDESLTRPSFQPNDSAPLVLDGPKRQSTCSPLIAKTPPASPPRHQSSSTTLETSLSTNASTGNIQSMPSAISSNVNTKSVLAATLTGLDNRSELNGTSVMVTRYITEMKCYEIILPEKGSNATKRVSPANLLFPRGTMFKLHSFLSATKYNGKQGETVRYLRDVGRYCVKIIDTEELVNVKPKHLRAIANESGTDDQNSGNSGTSSMIHSNRPQRNPPPQSIPPEEITIETMNSIPDDFSAITCVSGFTDSVRVGKEPGKVVERYTPSLPTKGKGSTCSITNSLSCERDESFHHAQRAGLMWQTLVGQHLTFPDSWFNRARCPLMGVESYKVEESKSSSQKARLVPKYQWHYIACNRFYFDEVLEFVVPDKNSEGKLLLHMIIREESSWKPVLDVAVGCYHPYAKGLPTDDDDMLDNGSEDCRILWMAVRRRQTSNIGTGGDKDKVSLLETMESYLTRERGIDNIQLPTPLFDSHHQVRNSCLLSLFGQSPPLETLFVTDNELTKKIQTLQMKYRSQGISITEPSRILIDLFLKIKVEL